MTEARLSSVLLALVLLIAGQAQAIILDPNAPAPASTPPDTFVGRWNNNASCVVVGSDMVITTRHQGGGVGSIVQIGGVNYTVSQVWTMTEPNVPDLQVAQLSGAAFAQYSLINTVKLEGLQRWPVVIGGYGMGRAETLYYLGDPNIPYGYAWDGSGNTTLRWGENVLTGARSYPGSGTYTSTLTDLFLAPGTSGRPADEAAIAEYDSGCGWFRNTDGNWYVVGVGWGVTDHGGATWWTDPFDANLGADLNAAVRVSTYASWIQSVLPLTAGWNVSTGDWSSAGSWTGGEPNAVATANVTNGGTATISQSGMACYVLTLGLNTGQSGNASMTGGSLTANTVYVGYQGTGGFTQTGGSHAISANLYLGYAAGASGTYHLSDGNLTVGGSEYVGYGGSGAFTQNGGKHTVSGQLYVGYTPGVSGTYTLSGGQLIVPQVSIGTGGALTLSGGVLRGDAWDANLLTAVNNGGLLHVTSGSSSVSSITTPGSPLLGTVQIDPGASLSARSIVQNSVTVGAGALLNVGPAAGIGAPATTSVINTLGLATSPTDGNVYTGMVDIKKNGLVIPNAGSVLSPAQILANYGIVNKQVGSGAGYYSTGSYVAGTGGITSSTAVHDPAQASGVGVIQGYVYGKLTGNTTFGGVAVDTSATSQAIMVGFTFQGDASMQGFTDFFTDYFQWQQGYSNQLNFGTVAYDPNLVGWEYGDFNGDGTVDFFNDYFLWQTGYTAYLNGQQLPTAPGVVPEPATLILLSLGGVAIVRRGRRTRGN